MITLGGVTFNEFATSGWVYSDLTDWFGQVGNKVPLVERPQAHGAFRRTRSLRESRAVSFKASFLGESVAQVQEAGEALAAVGADGPVVMSVATDVGVTWRNVSVEAINAADNKGYSDGDVTVDVIAEDPRRFASADWVQTQVASSGQGVVWPLIWPMVWPGGGSSGRVELVNTGKAPSSPVIRLFGGFGSALVTCVETGSRVGLDRPVPVGSYVEIDFATRRATIDGQSDVSRWLRWREWTDVPGGQSRSFQFDVTAPVGSPMMWGRVYPAWW